MKLERIDTTQLESKKTLKEVTKEAYQYGVDRGDSSACGDKYGMLGGPQFDNVLKDYLEKKFGVRGTLVEISGAIQKIPKSIIDSLERGFRKGYSEFDSKDDD